MGKNKTPPDYPLAVIPPDFLVGRILPISCVCPDTDCFFLYDPDGTKLIASRRRGCGVKTPLTDEAELRLECFWCGHSFKDLMIRKFAEYRNSDKLG